MLLASLPKSYEPLVVALESRDELPSLSTLKVKLIEEGERRKTKDNGEGSVQAFMVRDSNCTRNQNPQKINTSQYKKNNLKKIKCYNCKRRGHYAADCREQKRENVQNNNNNKISLFSTIGNSNLNSQVWCVDSGASSHLCCSRNMFVQYRQHNELIRLAGENSMKAEGIGKIRLSVGKNKITLVDVLYVPGLQCNFISVSKAVDFGNTVVFGGKVFK